MVYERFVELLREGHKLALEDVGMTKEEAEEVIREEPRRAGVFDLIQLPLMNVVGLVVDNENDIVYAVARAETNIVYYSRDMGESWTELWRPPVPTGVVLFYSHYHKRLFIWTDEPALYRGGIGIPFEKVFVPPAGKICRMDESKDGKLYLSISGIEPAEYYKSVYAGDPNTWEKILEITGTETLAYRPVIAGKGGWDADFVLVGCDERFYKYSTDAGATWADLPFEAKALAPRHPLSFEFLGTQAILCGTENLVARFTYLYNTKE